MGDSLDHHSQARGVQEATIQRWLQEHVGKILDIDPDKIDVNTPFNEYGLASVDAVGLSGELAEFVNSLLEPTIVYDYPTIALLARHLARPATIPGPEEVHTSAPAPGEEAIALVGMACRFPGKVTTPEAFWQLLSQGKNTTTEIPSQRWNAEEYYDPSPDAPGKMYTRYGCFVEDIDAFDANFFGISPREATRMDPQQRLLAEVTWEAVENAGLAMSTLAGSQTGVFVGMMNNYEYDQLQMQLEGDTYRDDPHAGTGSASSVASGRLAYLFDWQGPTLTVDTACSSSLVALHLACQSLRRRECTLAVVGGVNTLLLPETMVNACKMGMLSVDGYCKSFDASADGFVVGEGCGVVVLKPLSEALADNNPVLAVIRGSAVNQDGRSNGMTAPNKLAQEAVIRQALARAGVNPADLSYVEAHGSGTPLGDPIEIAALEAVFGEGRSSQQPLWVGTVKANIGHLVGAAGMAGLIKTVLALQHREIPPHPNLKQINPHIARVQHATVIPTELLPWQTEQQTRLAGVSSFGWSGTNAHVILEEAPQESKDTPAPVSAVPSHLLVLSAHTETALDKATENLVAAMQQKPDIPLAQIAYTLQTGRSPLLHRRMVVCRDREEAISALNAQMAQQVMTASRPTPRQVAFLLPGVGEQYMNLAQELYQVEPTFRETVDLCCTLLQERAGLNLHAALFSHGTNGTHHSSHSNGKTTADGKTTAFPNEGSIDLRKLLASQRQTMVAPANDLRQTVLAQPAAFIIEYSLARLLEKWGIRPVAMLGYSLGEYVAACLAGVFSLEDALWLVAQRAKMIQELPEGAMVAVFLSEQEIQPYLVRDICLAAVNAPGTCVLAGPVSDIERLEAHLTRKEIAYRRLETTHAFHSTMLNPLRERLTRLIEKIPLHAPRIAYISDVTGTWITEEQATNPEYWVQHMCQTVRFSSGVNELLQGTDAVLLEIGPGQSLSSFVRQHAACTRERAGLIFSTLPATFERHSDYACLLNAVGKMWLTGVSIDWSGFSSGRQQNSVLLPNYPFERQRYWIEGSNRSPRKKATETQERRLLADWFSIPGWKQVELVRPWPCELQEGACWLFLLDSGTPGERLVEHFRERQQVVVTVTRGPFFRKESDTAYMVRPGERADYEALFCELQTAGLLPQKIVHLWTTAPGGGEEARDLAEIIEAGFYSLIALAQALGNLDLPKCHITVISTELQNVAGDERICPEKALLLGPCRVLPQEYSMLTCSSIDIVLPPSGTSQEDWLLRQIVTELTSETEEAQVAFRGKRRWVQSLEPVVLDNHPEQADTPWREKGVYLITGGLGGIGLAMGEYLAHSVAARLVLVGRTALAPRDTWEQILAETADPSHGPARVIRAIQAMEARGSQVLTLQADVTDEAQVRAVIDQTLATFGTLNGVLHAAGVPGIGLTQLKTRAQTEKVLAPKVQGTRILQRVLANQPIDFLALFSSITSITGGGPGQVDYAAASAFLDAWAQSQVQRGGVTVAIDWGEWQWNAWKMGLEGYDAETQTFLKEHRQRFGISFEEGAEALTRILAAKLPHIVVSPQAIQAIIELGKSYTAADIQQNVSRRIKVHARPELATSYIAPRNETERKIAALWGEQLGIERVGINDNFFDLGGNSLIGMDMIRQIRKMFDLTDLPPHVLYEAPTIRLIAQQLEQKQTAASFNTKARERSEKRRGRQRQRAQETRKAS